MYLPIPYHEVSLTVFVMEYGAEETALFLWQAVCNKIRRHSDVDVRLPHVDIRLSDVDVKAHVDIRLSNVDVKAKLTSGLPSSLLCYTSLPMFSNLTLLTTLHRASLVALIESVSSHSSALSPVSYIAPLNTPAIPQNNNLCEEALAHCRFVFGSRWQHRL